MQSVAARVVQCCSVLQCDILCCRGHAFLNAKVFVQHTASNALQCIASHCIALLHVAAHCNTLQHFTTHRLVCLCALSNLLSNAQGFAQIHCRALQYTPHHIATQHRTATHCNSIQNIATHCNNLHILTRNTLQHTATHCLVCLHTLSKLLLNAQGFAQIHCHALQHSRHHTATHSNKSASHCNAVQGTATRCKTLQHTATH